MANDPNITELKGIIASQEQRILDLEGAGSKAAAIRNILVLAGMILGAIGTATVFVLTQWGHWTDIRDGLLSQEGDPIPWAANVSELDDLRMEIDEMSAYGSRIGDIENSMVSYGDRFHILSEYEDWPLQARTDDDGSPLAFIFPNVRDAYEGSDEWMLSRSISE